MKLIAAIATLGLFVLAPSIGYADPCTAQLPRRASETFSGTVRYVGDGDSLCVGQSNDPATWIEVRRRIQSMSATLVLQRFGGVRDGAGGATERRAEA